MPAALTARLLVLVLAAALLPAGSAAAATRRTDPFDGVGTWVSVFMDTWESPGRHVARMHRRGVRTLYLQTSSSATPVHSKIFQPQRAARFIEAAHARGMKVVAWYLPPLRNVPVEYERAMAAIRFRTPSGQRFDGFALDIEPSARTPRGPARNRNLLRLSRRIRRSVPDRYPLGAVIPSPVGMRLSKGFWPKFPYEELGRIYDVSVPMSYYTWRVEGPGATYDYNARNIAIIRRRMGADMRIHMIGGEAGQSGRRETRAFVRAAVDRGAQGVSLWHYGVHGPEDWQELRRFQ